MLIAPVNVALASLRRADRVPRGLPGL